MSDDYIAIVPRDPTHIPAELVQLRVSALLSRLAPSADSITPKVTAVVRFYDCGGNFERVSCPRCMSELAVDWWQERMSKNFDGEGFRLGNFDTPCCGAASNLNTLDYEWPQAFGRFSWTIRNARIGELTDGAKAELQIAAGVPIVVVHRHT